MKILIALLLMALSWSTCAASVRERWSFAWDPHPQADQVGYFDLEICVPSRCEITRIVGGTSIGIQDVLVDPGIPGNGIAVLRACTPSRVCSGNSNAVDLDRTPPPAPSRPAFIPGFIHPEGHL
jgi:hypothetical protein